MISALVRTLDLFRPAKGSSYDSSVSYSKATLTGIKLGQPSKGWTVDTAGSVRSATATLYWNIGHSGQSPAMSPVFKVGDILCQPSESSEPSDDRLTVQSVTEQTFKGMLHHYEVVLV